MSNNIDLITDQIQRMNILSNRTFSYIKERKETKFYVSRKSQIFYYNSNDNRIYKFYNNNVKKVVCKYIHSDDKFCTNFDYYCGYCRFHLDGEIQDLKSDIEIGDISEKCIFDILLHSNELINVKIVGNFGYKLDIIYQVKEEVDRGITYFRGIQVKTISIKGINDSIYYLNTLNKYELDTLMVGINKDQDKFCLIFCDNIDSDKQTLSLYFNEESSYLFEEDKKNIITGLTFEEQLIKMCKTSTIFDFYLTEMYLGESFANIELQKQCKLQNLTFDYHTTMDSDIDVIINNKNVQCKSSNRFHSENLFQFNLKTKRNGQVVAYSENTKVEFFIFIGKENDIFSIYIIPKVVLVYLGFLSSSIYPNGKLSINIPVNNCEKFHMFKQFKNRYDLLKRNDIKYDEFIYCENNILSRFLLELNKSSTEDIKFIRDNTNIQTNCGYFKDNFAILTPSLVRNNSVTYIIKSPTKRHNKSYYDIFIFEENKTLGIFLIIPRIEFINRYCIDAENNIFKKSFTIPTSFSITVDHWACKYINNFNLLK